MQVIPGGKIASTHDVTGLHVDNASVGNCVYSQRLLSAWIMAVWENSQCTQVTGLRDLGKYMMASLLEGSFGLLTILY